MSEFHRIDVVAALKRAVDGRLRWLNTQYELNKMPLASKPDGLIDLCHRLGVLRSLMVSKLHRIRNRLEHQDVHPPSEEDCGELVEFVWYFLKSTDSRAREVPYEFTLDAQGGVDDAPHWVSVYTGPRYKWGLGIRACVPAPWIASTSDDWILLECDQVTKAGDLRKELPAASRLSRNRDDDVYISARVLGHDRHRDRIYELYFQAD